jgi:hypothetical protein
MTWTLPQGLALGRSGGVGVDGSLTGRFFFTFFIVCMGMARGAKKIFRGRWSAGLGMPGWLAGSEFSGMVGSSKSGFSAICFYMSKTSRDQASSSQTLHLSYRPLALLLPPQSMASWSLSDSGFELFMNHVFVVLYQHDNGMECSQMQRPLEPPRSHPRLLYSF